MASRGWAQQETSDKTQGTMCPLNSFHRPCPAQRPLIRQSPVFRLALLPPKATHRLPVALLKDESSALSGWPCPLQPQRLMLGNLEQLHVASERIFRLKQHMN